MARKDVTLVLEPTGTIMVMAAPDVKGEVLVRAFSAAAHGPDAAWVDPGLEGANVQPDFPVDDLATSKWATRPEGSTSTTSVTTR